MAKNEEVARVERPDTSSIGRRAHSQSVVPAVQLRHSEFVVIMDSMQRAARSARSASSMAEAAASSFKAEACALEAAATALSARTNL